MFAVITTGGKQYKVEQGSELDVELLDGKKEGDEVFFDKVLMLLDKDVNVGTPYIKDASVSGKILKLYKDKKVTCFKFKNKTNQHKTKGHRQNYARVKIELIKGASAGSAQGA